MFTIVRTSKISRARLSHLSTNHGAIDGPIFFPIATRGAVKHVAADELKSLGASGLLSNTYHLLLAPGPATIARAGGLHRFMHWTKPILTDSGGFQVFSLTRYRQVSDRGVVWRDPASGTLVELTPERVLQIQRKFGSDIMMVLDECVGYPATRQAVASAVARTTAWAKATLRAFRRQRSSGQLLFGIVQGGTNQQLRERSLADLVKLEFDGYAIGGLAVGESRTEMFKVIERTAPKLPSNKPRYLMGVGRPEEIVAAVRHGIDMFDCVIPTREARHGRLYVWRNDLATKQRPRNLARRKLFYDTWNINNKKFARTFKPVSENCECPGCKQYTLAYLRHLFKVKEPLGQRLATLHNLKFYLDLMAAIRSGIRRGFV